MVGARRCRDRRIKGRGGRVADASLPWGPGFDEGPCRGIGSQAGTNWVSQDIGPFFAQVIITPNSVIEAALLPSDGVEVTHLSLKSRDHRTEAWPGCHYRHNMHVIGHGQHQYRRPIANAAQALAGLELRRPSIVARELIQSARLTAKGDEDGVRVINPGRSIMAKPAAVGIVHGDMEAGAGRDSKQETTQADASPTRPYLSSISSAPRCCRRAGRRGCPCG